MKAQHSLSLFVFSLFIVLVVSQQTWVQRCAKGTCIPQNIHIALTGDETQMAVSWLTLYHSPTSTVKFGLSANNLNGVAYGTQSSYLTSVYYDITFWNHDTVIENLQPSTVYFYQCGDEFGGWSGIYNFTTAPSRQAAPQTLTIAVYGDMGIANAQHTIKKITDRIHPVNTLDFIFHLGDISYADDYNDGMYEAVWNEWFTTVEPIAAYVPYMVGPGNHEYSCRDVLACEYTRNFTAYLNRFRMPWEESGGVNNMWHSFDYSNVHFIMMNTETDYPGAPEGSTMFGDQLDWLENDLISASSDPSIDWIIVGGHRPIYSSGCSFSNGTSPKGDCIALQTAVENLFYQYKVSVFFSGHVHSYERNYPIYQNVPYINGTLNYYQSPTVPVYIVSGAAGSTEGHASCWNDPPPSWSAYRENTSFGYGILTITPTQLTWDFYNDFFEKPIDSVVIAK